MDKVKQEIKTDKSADESYRPVTFIIEKVEESFKWIITKGKFSFSKIN